ncbi:TetR/AcrR family transcriptional regulator [Luteimonas fraxinea]|uniref:TetR/AcrR family transcriptional regulator n=1 Tax=Luteimonas fraxinea TaxID=2901869 RepID=UPI001E595058|nr:TetR family transcriptional regulator [Luteimonas fraxinea]MCD9125869.1 TetR/AcrR family transcriptional regulator [Luteimonas fraxinea]
MRVTKAQASANRAHVVETASALFRERGYDGVGVADLMAAAGFTHGGFYKQFQSKADLMAEAAACGFEQAAQRAAVQSPADFIAHYLSREHRDHRGAGCTMAALGADAARQSDAVRATFAEGIEGLLTDLRNADGDAASRDVAQSSRAQTLEMMARLVGALVLSRACPDDSPLADEILEACRGQEPGMRQKGNSEAV